MSSFEESISSETNDLTSGSHIRRIKNASANGDTTETSLNDTDVLDESDVALPTPPFAVDQRVFALTDGEYHPAIIRQPRPEGEEWSFLVHFQGWNSRFDRWTQAGGIRPDTEEHRAVYLAQQEEQAKEKEQQQLKENEKQQQKQQQQSATKKRKLPSSQPSQFYYSYFCALPFTLRTVLVDEHARLTGWDSTKQGWDTTKRKRPARLVHALPAAVPMRKFFKVFWKNKKSQLEKDKRPPLQDFLTRLTQLLEQAFPVCLLYPQERPQYELWRRENPETSILEVYGCEYLLRFYARLPLLLSAQRDDVADDQIGPWLTEILVLMQTNRATLFKANGYRPPQPEEWTTLEKAVHKPKTKKDTKNTS